jgi:hypothetical protein
MKTREEKRGRDNINDGRQEKQCSSAVVAVPHLVYM